MCGHLAAERTEPDDPVPIDRGTECLIEDLTRLTHANMEDEIERFTSALASDAIWPMDF